jgi:hypothetical protein
MDAISVKAPSTQGTRSRLAWAQPRAGIVDQGRFTPRPRVSSSNGRTFDSPEAQLGQASRRSNLGQVAMPTDCIAGAINARIAWHLILTHAPQSTRSQWPQSLRRSTDWPDRKTAPPALLWLLCHSPERGRQQLSPASGTIGSSASPDPRAWPPSRPRKTVSTSPDPRAQTQPRPRKTNSALLDPRAQTQPRPRKTDSASPDPRARTQPRPRKTVSASPDPRARTQPRLRKTVSASPDPRARTQPRLRKTVSASPDPRAQTQPRPRRSHRLARPQTRTDHVTGGPSLPYP